MTKQLLFIFCVISSVAFSAQALVKDNTAMVCKRMKRIPLPKGANPDECYDQAKEFLRSKNVKFMIGSYQAYFALSQDETSQKTCRNFLRNVVLATQDLELENAKEIFGNDRAYSLDRAYYSYGTCQELTNPKEVAAPRQIHASTHRTSRSAK